MKTFGLRMAGLEATRRRLVLGAGALASAAVLLGGMRDARAQDYPSQDIRLICAFPAGSGADVLVRYFAEKLRPIASRTVIVENKVGASGNIAAEYLAKSKPDGHTIFVRWFVQMVSSDETKEFLNKFGGEAYITTPEKAQELFEAAIKEWGDYVRIAKIEPLG